MSQLLNDIGYIYIYIYIYIIEITSQKKNKKYYDTLFSTNSILKDRIKKNN